jgi:uncharacterized protein YjbI with pentapeptide repeats
MAHKGPIISSETIGEKPMVEIRDRSGNILLIVDSPSLANARLSGKYLRGAELAGVDLSNADLRDCNLREANLKGARLNGAVSESTDLRGACLDEVDLSVTSTHRDAKSPHFSKVFLEAASLKNANLSHCFVIECCLRDCDFRAADFSDAILSGCQINRADFRGAILRKTRVFGCNFGFARCEGVDLSEVQELWNARDLQ